MKGRELQAMTLSLQNRMFSWCFNKEQLGAQIFAKVECTFGNLSSTSAKNVRRGY
jgi:hypothetical protein